MQNQKGLLSLWNRKLYKFKNYINVKFMGHVPEKFNYKLSSQTTKKIELEFA